MHLKVTSSNSFLHRMIVNIKVLHLGISTGLGNTFVAGTLSQRSGIGRTTIHKSSNNLRNIIPSSDAVDMEMYSAAMLNLDTMA
jgi:hypothetical protein